MTELHACTIASNNYLAMASVFAESYLRHHPRSKVYACVVDEPSPSVSYSRLPFTPVFARDLGIPAFRNMAFRYDVMELNTAVKPFFLKYLRDRHGLDRVLYFDPDILVLDRLGGLEKELRQVPMVLTPHITEPLEDGFTPSERLIRQVGVYNLGFLGIRLDEATRGFLDWWARRLYRYGLNDPAHGLFVDQSWMDLAPAFLEGVRVERNPIYNVAYWNLAHRFPRREGGRWMIDGKPMAFFHFSGFDADDLEPISRHQNRLRLSDREELRPLLEDYRSLLVDRDFWAGRELPYAYGTFDGIPLSIPRCLRRTLVRIDPEGRRWADPFATEGGDTFFSWLEETHEYRLGALPRAALCLWEDRWDLRAAFPDVTGDDLPAFARWLKRGGGLEAGLWPAAVEGARSEASPGTRRAAAIAPRSRRVGENDASLDLRRSGFGVTWLNQPVSGLRKDRPRLTTAALLLHEMRPDVQSAYPDPRGDDQVRYAHWFVFHGSAEAGLDAELVAPVARSLPVGQRLKYFLRERLRRKVRARPATPAAFAPRTRSATPSASEVSAAGVNLAGYFSMNTGVGQTARASLAALETAGIPVCKVELEATVLGGFRAEDGAGAPYPVSLIHANADQSRIALAELPAAAAAGSYKVGYWFWELAHFPLAFSDRFAYFDEIWAPSRFCAESYQALSSIPVRHVPPCVLPPQPPATERSALGLDRDRFYFYFSFDVSSVPERKNPFAAIEAISRLARSASRPVGLVLRVLRGERNHDLVQRLRSRSRGLPVVLVTERNSREDFDALLAACDACLSLHRSEGLGLLPIETMYLGKPVVATNYGGVTDYLDESTGFPVQYELRRLETAQGPYPAGAAWAEPSIEDAVDKMRAVVESSADVLERAVRGQRRVRSLYSVEAAAQRFAVEIQRILGPISPADVPRALAETAVAASAAVQAGLAVDSISGGT